MREGWELKKLGDVCSVLNGYAFKSKDTVEQSDTQLLRMGNLYQNKLDLTRKPVFYPSRFVDDYSEYVLKTDDLIMSLTGTVDKIDYGYTVRITSNKVNLLLNQRIMKITVLDGQKLDDKYLHLFLLSPEFLEALYATSNGTRQANLSSKTILTLSIPVPPLKEQKQIVSTLDKAFKQIDQAKANLEQNLHNAKELFQSKLNEVFSQRGEGWGEKRLGEACILIMGQSPKGTTYNFDGVGMPLINGPVEFGKNPFSKTVKTKFTTAPKKLCRENDLILCVRGSTTGKINIAGFEACIGRGVASIRFEENQKWLNFFIRANQSYIYSLGTGSTFPNVSGTILSKILFPIPPIDEQIILVEMMESLLENTDKLIIHYQQKLNNLEELKKSILQKAFRGMPLRKQHHFEPQIKYAIINTNTKQRINNADIIGTDRR